jgi:hypothetical protein
LKPLRQFRQKTSTTMCARIESSRRDSQLLAIVGAGAIDAN